MGEMKTHAKCWSETLNQTDRLGDVGIDGRPLEWNFGKQGVRIWIKFNWLLIDSNGGIL
jgi:hypothetical protein